MGDIALSLEDEPKYVVYQSVSGKYGFKLIASDGELLARSGQLYETRNGCKNAVEALRKYSDSPVDDLTAGEKDKVFIVHGRNDREALLLQKYLRNHLKVDAFVFDDLPDKGRTIIEQLEFIRDKVWYAFAIATADDSGCLGTSVSAANVGALKTRARQNVVFELGLFIGALGRENVCCLLQGNVEEKPSDISGILYKSFTKSVEEKFHEIEREISDRRG